VEYECTCPNCRTTTVETITVPDELGRVGEKDTSYPGFDTLTLPECQDVLQVRPLQVKDESIILAREPASKALMTDRVMHILMPIVSINDGKPDAWEEATRWYNALSPSDAQYLEDRENELYPHLATEIPHLCDQCQKKFKHTLDFTAEFFRPSLKPSHGTKMASNVRPGVEREGANFKSQGSAGPISGADGGLGKRKDRSAK
jgi:hypothetical protein